MGSPDPAPDKVGPSQPPLNFVDGNAYIVLRGLVEARDCEVGWNKVMKAWGSGDEKAVAKNFELLFNVARSEEQAKDPALPRRWQSKSSLGSGVGRPLFKKFHPHLTESVPGVGDLHPMTPGSVIVASVGSGPQLPHTNVATHPEVLPPHDLEVGTATSVASSACQRTTRWRCRRGRPWGRRGRRAGTPLSCIGVTCC